MESRPITPPDQIQSKVEPHTTPLKSYYNSSVTEFTSPSAAQAKQDRDERLDNAAREFNYHWIGPMKAKQFVHEYLAKDTSQMQDREESDPNFQRLKEVMEEEYRLENVLNHNLVCPSSSASYRPHLQRFSV
jgi:hypothetical protein